MGRCGPWTPLILMGLMVLAVVIGPIPTVPISVASGVVFRPVLVERFDPPGIRSWLVRMTPGHSDHPADRGRSAE